ncbi:hypothetical protein [Rhodococcus sp. 1139]|uniref:hypothetical protein n=1 Tax=Rhodococcus sp. 1139 TaxID=1833762 RepID=UPI00210EAAD5|nr:hypothetical protein [Rhodococcus sp. 1139]
MVVTSAHPRVAVAVAVAVAVPAMLVARATQVVAVEAQVRAAVVPLQRIVDRLYLSVAAAAISETTVTLRQRRQGLMFLRHRRRWRRS